MLKIAVCEDDPAAAALCRSHIGRFEEENGVACAVSFFGRGTVSGYFPCRNV